MIELLFHCMYFLAKQDSDLDSFIQRRSSRPLSRHGNWSAKFKQQVKLGWLKSPYCSFCRRGPRGSNIKWPRKFQFEDLILQPALELEKFFHRQDSVAIFAEEVSVQTWKIRVQSSDLVGNNCIAEMRCSLPKKTRSARSRVRFHVETSCLFPSSILWNDTVHSLYCIYSYSVLVKM